MSFIRQTTLWGTSKKGNLPFKTRSAVNGDVRDGDGEGERDTLEEVDVRRREDGFDFFLNRR